MPTESIILDPLRNERRLDIISGRLRDIAEARFDLVTPLNRVHSPKNGTFDRIHLAATEPMLTSAGVIDGDVEAMFTRTAIRQLCDKLGLPIKYLDFLTSDRPEFAERVLHELAGHNVDTLCRVSDKSVMLRYLALDEGLVLRSVLSDSYRAMDNDLVLRAVLAGLQANDLDLANAEVWADVNPDRFRLRVAFPDVAVDARHVLGNYRSPYSGRDASSLPMLWAGFELANSETGHGALSLRERAVFEVCSNGMTRPVEFRRTHVGERLDEGVIEWSERTRDAALELITSQVSDAIATYITTDRLQATVDEMAAASEVSVESPSAAVEVVQQRFGLTDAERTSVFDAFAAGGDTSVMGLGQAVTAAAQRVEDGDRQTELEQRFWDIVSQPAAFSRI